MSRLVDKIALITGGASGIGAATARRFVSEGAKVVIADINDSLGQQVAESIGQKTLAEALDLCCSYVHLDVTSEESWRHAVNSLRELHGRLDILVNSAGIGAPSTIEEATLEHWHQVHRINADSVFLGCKHGLGLMKETTRAGSIVNLSSTLGLRPQPMFTAYNSSKASVWAVTRTVALHCCEQGYPIRCNAVHPGATLTPMMETYLASAPDREAAIGMIASNHPMKRVGRPEEIANAILFLASDEASFITGVSLPVDGGYCAA